MIPAGYMFKKVISRPAWLKAADVDDVFSLSGCISENFTDYIDVHCRHQSRVLAAVMQRPRGGGRRQSALSL
jgi:hypothetical protein